MTLCTRCNKRPIELARRPICRPCKQEYDREWWQANKSRKSQDKLAASKRSIERAQEYVWQYLLEHHCSCGESDAVVLQFDHLRDKKFDISDGVKNGVSVPKLAEEVKKCQVLCSNCHIKKTAKDFGFWKTKRGMA